MTKNQQICVFGGLGLALFVSIVSLMLATIATIQLQRRVTALEANVLHLETAVAAPVNVGDRLTLRGLTICDETGTNRIVLGAANGTAIITLGDGELKPRIGLIANSTFANVSLHAPGNAETRVFITGDDERGNIETYRGAKRNWSATPE